MMCPAMNRRAIIAPSEGRTKIDREFIPGQNGGHDDGENGGHDDGENGGRDDGQNGGRDATDEFDPAMKCPASSSPALKCRFIIAPSEGRTTIDREFIPG